MPTDPAEFILEELELGDIRLARYRPDLLRCIAAAIDIVVAQGAKAIQKGKLSGSGETLKLPELPDLLACLEKIVAASFDEGQARGEYLADQLGDLPREAFGERAPRLVAEFCRMPSKPVIYAMVAAAGASEPAGRDVFEIPRAEGQTIADRIKQLARGWHDAIRQAVVEKVGGFFRKLLGAELPDATLRAVGKDLTRVAISLDPIEKAGREVLAGESAAELIEAAAESAVQTAKAIPASGELEKIQEWADTEVRRIAESTRSTVGEQAVIGADVEAHELGKLAVAEEDPRVRVVVFNAVLDGRTTCLCGGLHHFSMDVRDKRRGRYMPPLHINCRSSISFENEEPNFDVARSVTVNDRPFGTKEVVRTTYFVAPASIKPSPLGGTAPPPRVLSEVIG